MKNKQKFLEKILRDLEAAGGIERSAIITRDGVLMYSLKKNVDAMAAMLATLFASAEHMLAELNKGVPVRVIIENSNYRMVAIGVGPKDLLLIVANPDVDLGMLLLIAEKASQEIKQILE